MEYAGGVRDWILARFDDLHPVEQGIEPAPSPSSQYDREGSAGDKSLGALLASTAIATNLVLGLRAKRQIAYQSLGQLL